MTGDGVLDGHIQRLFDWFLETEPFFATHMGRHEYDDRVPDASRDRQLRDIETAKGFRADIADVEPTTLSPGKRVDRNLMLHTLDLNLYEQEGLRFWESYPQGASGMGGGLFSLFMRDFAPLPQRMASITARLEKYPAMLEQHKTRITRPVSCGARSAWSPRSGSPASSQSSGRRARTRSRRGRGSAYRRRSSGRWRRRTGTRTGSTTTRSRRRWTAWASARPRSASS
ncbi:MAG: DUF885 family protein [Candidatus Thermoplasmatota archaeon]